MARDLCVAGPRRERGRARRALAALAGAAALLGLGGLADLDDARAEVPANPPTAAAADHAAAAAAADPSPAPSLISAMRPLTLDGRRSGEGYFSADGKKLVFQSEREPGNPFYQIYLLDLESGETRRVSPGYGKTTCAWIHPSGDRVLFASTHADPEARAKQKAELDFRATGQERRYSWDYDENYDLYAAATSGGELTRLTREKGYDAEGSYAPDGRSIVFASNRRAYTEKLSAADREQFERDPSYMMDLYIMAADGSKVRRLTDAPGYDGGPFFSPDGKRIVWRRFTPDGVRAEIYSMKTDGSDVRKLTDLGAMSWAPFYHPSGEYVIFTTNLQGFANFELYLVSAQGGPAVRVTQLDGFDGLPVFSPAGDRLVWTRRPGRGDAGSQLWSARWDHEAARAALARAAAEPRPARAEAKTAVPGGVEGIREHIAALASERMEGRRTGTPGERLATQYVADAFAELGLEPAGKEGYFRPFDFTAGLSLGVGNRFALLRGPPAASGHGAPEARPAKPSKSAGREFRVDRQWRPLAFSATGDAAAADVVFAGYGIVAPKAEGVEGYDSYAGLEVRDRWVVVFRDLPDDISPERRQQLARFAGLRYKSMTARNLGARGLLFVSGPRSQFKEPLAPLRFDVAMGGTSVFALSVTDDVAEQILAGSGKKLGDLQAALAKGEAVAGFAVPGARLEAAVDLKTERRSGRNVLGRLKLGGESAGPPLVIGAHVDHLGRGAGSESLARENERDAIHPGADDNASGVAALLEVARRLVAERDALVSGRDVLFAAWSGEELGLLGSEDFVSSLPAPNPHESGGPRPYAAYINMDMVGRLREQLFVQGVGSSSDWRGVLERANLAGALQPGDGDGGGAGAGIVLSLSDDAYLPTDATSFFLKGIPVLSFFTGVHEEYHTPRDTPDKLNYPGIEQVSGLVTSVSRALVQRKEPVAFVQVQRKASDPGRANIRVFLGTIPSYGQQEIQGVLLSGVGGGSPAEKAGLQAEDVIVELAGTKIENIYDYTYALEALKVGQPVEIVVLRKGQRVPLKISPASRE